MSGSLAAFSKALAATPGSQFIQSESWLIPSVQTVHILAIAVVLSSVGMVNLRVLGLAGMRSSVTETADRYAPWLWGALIVLLMTGSILVWGEPERDLSNWAFQLKMVLVLVLVVVTALFRWRVARGAGAWDAAGEPPVRAKLMTLAAMAVCVTIAVLGRWIAYAVTG